MLFMGTRKSRPDMIRIAAITGALAASTLLGGWGFDAQGPYCLYDPEYTNCGYPSLEACLATARGAGGYCAPNPRYVEAPPQRRRVR
jgi:hypothetical protein